MDSDFHYYGTGTAALAAGFGKADARLIANVAQFVDWFDSDYWSYWSIVDDRGDAVIDSRSKRQFEYGHPQLSIQKIDWKMAFDYDRHIWNAFHFPPGNLPYTASAGGWREEFRGRHVVRASRLAKEDAGKLCRPFSEFALAMIEDTAAQFAAISAAKDQQLESLIESLVRPRVRCPVSDGRRLALFLLGVRMHVLADTWAHQDFTGEQNEAVNAAGIDNRVKAKDHDGRYQPTQWTGTLWALARRHRLRFAAPNPALGGNTVCAGHGQLGHFPDYSWLTFRYPAAWLPEGKRWHVRNNPREYLQAWSWLSLAMGLCGGSVPDDARPPAVPGEIEAVIRRWHPLSPDGLTAIARSEALWRDTPLGRELPARWNPARRAGLGLFDGLARTRFGTIHVRRNSILHYMETAAAIHYQFCADWMAARPDHGWRVRPAET